jgi:hypothetical protein
MAEIAGMKNRPQPADWVDAETGEATEGQSPPYLEGT